jgi:hypothetical protein
MKIISRFTDYYDGPARRMGDDPLYIRTASEIRAEPNTSNFQSLSREMAKSKLTDREFYWKLFVVKVGNLLFSGLSIVRAVKIPYEQREYDWKTVEHVTDCLFEGRNRDEVLALQLAKKCMPVSSTPIVVITDDVIYQDVSLSDLQLYKVLSPYDCAMELDRYLSNLASPVVKPRPVADIVKVASHGFDVKYSFRKGKQK